MRENRPYGSEGGAGDIPPFLPLSDAKVHEKLPRFVDRALGR